MHYQRKEMKLIPHRRSQWLTKTLCVVALFFFVSTLLCHAQNSTNPLSKDDVLELLHNGVASKRISVLARQHKIDFQVDAATATELKQAGATSELITSLKNLAPPPAATKIVVQSNPGGAQVYIDDEPIGTTSPEGRLKISTLVPGQHRIRISLEGYQDFSRNFDASQGEETDVDASLQLVRAIVPDNNNAYNNSHNQNLNNNPVVPPGGQAVVYFFRPANFNGNLITPQIYCDGTSVGKLPNGRYFSMNLPAGRHVFNSTSKKTRIEMDLAGGNTYYVMVSMVTGFPSKGVVSIVPNENGSAALGTLAPCGTNTGQNGNQVSGCGQ